jgi:nucleotide-binding universal stress UspA family protein
MKLGKILVPLDGSNLAELALAKALDVAQSSGDPTLVLLRAAEASAWPGTDPTEEQIRVVREAEDYLAGIEAGLVKQGVQKIQTSVWYGPPASAIVEAADVAHADLIVMSTHGRGGLGRLIMGSVADAVLRGTTTPILLVRSDGAPLDRPIGVAEAHGAQEVRR